MFWNDFLDRQDKAVLDAFDQQFFETYFKPSIIIRHRNPRATLVHDLPSVKQLDLIELTKKDPLCTQCTFWNDSKKDIDYDVL